MQQRLKPRVNQRTDDFFICVIYRHLTVCERSVQAVERFKWNIHGEQNASRLTRDKDTSATVQEE